MCFLCYFLHNAKSNNPFPLRELPDKQEVCPCRGSTLRVQGSFEVLQTSKQLTQEAVSLEPLRDISRGAALIKVLRCDIILYIYLYYRSIVVVGGVETVEISKNPITRPFSALGKCCQSVERRGIACGKKSRVFSTPCEMCLLCLWKTHLRISSNMFATRADVLDVIILFRNSTSPIPLFLMKSIAL